MPKLDRVIDGLSAAVAAVRRVLRFLLGTFSWEAPPWVAALGGGLRRGAGWVKTNRARAVAVVGALVLLAGAGPCCGAGTSTSPGRCWSRSP
jgi:hypothetical protein